MTRFDGPVGFNRTPLARQPFGSTQVLPAGSPGGEDLVAHSLNTVVTGDHSGATGSNPGFVWGANVFTTTGTAPGDANGVRDLFGALIEASVAAPAGSSVDTVIGLCAEAAFFGATAGAKVRTMMSMRVAKPKRKDGATGGTVTGTAYGLFIEGVRPEDTGATAAQSLCVESGWSWFGGPVWIDNQNLSVGTGTLSARRVHLTDTAVGGPGGYLEVHNGALRFRGGGGTVTTLAPA